MPKATTSVVDVDGTSEAELTKVFTAAVGHHEYSPEQQAEGTFAPLCARVKTGHFILVFSEHLHPLECSMCPAS